MSNCLVTKLKDVASIDNPVLLGKLRVKLTTTMFLKFVKNTEIDVETGSVTVASTTYTAGESFVLQANTLTKITLNSEDAVLLISDKYSLSDNYCPGAGNTPAVALSGFGLMPALISLLISPDNKYQLSSNTLQYIGRVDGGVIYVRNAHPSFIEAPNLLMFIIGDSGLINLTEFSKYLKLELLRLEATGVFGELNEFASSQVSCGRESGILQIKTSYNIFIDDTKLPYNTFITIKYGTDMVNPTTEETEQGYQIITS